MQPQSNKLKSQASAGSRLSDLTDLDLRQHLESLGFEHIESYQIWCRTNGLSDRIEKNWKQRCHERYLAKAAQIKQERRRRKRQAKNGRQTLLELFRWDHPVEDLLYPYNVIALRLRHLSDESTRLAALKLLLKFADNGTLTKTHFIRLPYRNRSVGQLVTGVFSLARVHRKWIRSIENWSPRHKNTQRQFCLLARHLLVRYPLPSFMDSVWFREDHQASKMQQWFCHIGQGGSLKEVEFPVQLTRKMNRYFLQAPQQYSVESALRWAQVKGMGGSKPHCDIVAASQLVNHFENEQFWNEVLQWTVAQPLWRSIWYCTTLDQMRIAKFGQPNRPIVDSRVAFCKMQTYYWRACDAGRTRRYPDFPIDPDFQIRGRTANSLHRKREEWRARFAFEALPKQQEWNRSEFKPFLLIQDQKTWEIVELTNQTDLFHDGQSLRHCVAIYAEDCINNLCSIWSLRLKRRENEQERKLTIEVDNHHRKIVQIRGRANRYPRERELKIVRRWADENGLSLAAWL